MGQDREISSLDRHFDEAWYLAAYPDVQSYPDGPKAHYRRHGPSERRAPHPLFDLRWYMERHPELARDGIEPLNYYFEKGWRQLHSPHPLFDPARYLLDNPDLIAAALDPIRHYLDHGWREGRSLHPLFDTRWYLATNPDVAALGQDPLSHFLTTGWREGRQPHPLFDMRWYLEQNADLARAGQNPWLHYILSGWREGRAPHPDFDAAWYLTQHLDDIALTTEPLAHYLREGWREGLRPSPTAPSDPKTDGPASPLYLEAITRARAEEQNAQGLAQCGQRGTIALVVHETEVGGAPHVLKQFALWLRDHTRFNIRIISLRNGNLRHAFEAIAPLLVLSDHAEELQARILEDWLGEDIRGVFLNSIASGDVLRVMPKDLPVAAFIHELPKVLDLFPEALDLVRARASMVIGGGPDVTRALRDTYGFAPEKLASGFSFIEALPPETDYAHRRTLARASLGLGADRLVVMGCGLLHWRKSPDKFIETAEAVLAAGVEADFIWLGGGPDQEACEKLVAEKGLSNHIRFTGYEPDVAGKLAAGDIFLLSSQEDPFPLVALYAAQAGMPIVCFREAGGIEGFVSRGGGRAVPFLDVAAMTAAVLDYARDPDARQRDGKEGRAQVARGHTIDIIGPLLLHHLRVAMNLPPEVSVVVPNYNYEAYLPERLASIAAQSFQDFEVILLDDASPDGSVPVLEAFAALRSGTKLVVNAQNSGSPFIQWMKGMDLAQAELIWLAEADDRCRPDFLQTLLPLFDDRNMRIASCASQPVTAEGDVIGDYRPLYLDRITPGRWDQDYIATDHEEANAGLGIANSIPNASAVIFRKFRPEPEFVEELTSMRLCGDWYFYVRAMRGGLVGFSAALLNDHRRHGNTVTHKLEGSLRYFKELASVRGYLGETYRQNTAAQARIAEFLAQDINRFNVAEPKTLPQPPAAAKTLPSLLMVAPDLSPGGGQVFAISIANEWARRGGRVVLLNVANQPSHPAMLAKIAPEVMLLDARDPGHDLASLIQRFDIDAVHSGIWWADRWIDLNREALPPDMPWVITMHGCHETILANPGIDPSFPERMRRMIKRASWAYIADKNCSVFAAYGQPEKLFKIPNGVEEGDIAGPLERSDLGLRPEAITLCLASRAIPEKGWPEAVRVTERLNAAGHKVDLLLLGEGPAEQRLRAGRPAHVHFMGQVSHPHAYFTLADIGLLPSSFVGESLPLVLLEMMSKGLPLVASQIGEIPNIIGTDEDAAAGLLVPLAEDGIDEQALYDALLRLMQKETRLRMGRAARQRYEESFTISRMMERYSNLYQTSAQSTAS